MTPQKWLRARCMDKNCDKTSPKCMKFENEKESDNTYMKDDDCRSEGLRRRELLTYHHPSSFTRGSDSANFIEL